MTKMSGLINFPNSEALQLGCFPIWGASEFQRSPPSLFALFFAPVWPNNDPEFLWPSPCDIHTAQADALKNITAASSDPLLFAFNAQGLRVTKHGSIRIPTDAKALQLCICIIGHCGRGSHRGLDATFKNKQNNFFCSSVNTNLSTLFVNCWHFPRPSSVRT